MQVNNNIDFSQLLSSRKYNPEFTPPPDATAFRVQGEPVGNLGSFIVFSGLPKAGKSRFFMAAIGSAITKREIFTMTLTPPKERPRIAIFDTESSQSDFYKNIDQLKNFAGVNRLPDNIDAYCTRQDEPHTQIKLINQYCNQCPETSVLIIDGLLDLVMNYNDETESRQLINWLKKLTTEKNILVMSVLHTGKDGTQRLGHLGANTDRWAQSTLSVRKEANENNPQKSKYILEAKFLRSSAGFTPVEIEYNETAANWVMINGGEVQSKNHWKFYTQSKHAEKIELLFMADSMLSYDRAIERLKEVEHRGTNYAKEYFKYLKENELITQNLNGLWFNSKNLF